MEHAYYSQDFPDDMDDQAHQFEGNDKDNDELLIDAVRGYPHLYDTSLKEYKDIRMKENSWREIALFMNMSVDNCQTRWLRLRERFTKELRLQETENRSGSAAGRRPVFAFYNNMIFLKNYIKRRKSYTNVANPAIKKRAVDIPNVCTDKHNSAKNAKNASSHHFLDTFGHADSNLSFTSNSDILLEEMEIAPKTNNFSHNQHFQEINKFQNVQNAVDLPHISQEINTVETGSNRSSPPLQSESRNSCNTSQMAASISNSTSSPTLQTTVSSNTRIQNSGKIKNRSTTHLESSIASLSNTLQNRLANPSCPTDNKHTAWNINNLTPERRFGLLIAVELEQIPELEKSKRKQAIAEILWKPCI